MSEGLSKELIMDTAEQVFRRFGLEKTTVVDVAKALGVSHASIYKYFPSKASLREGVATRWLHHVSSVLEQLESESPTERLYQWLVTLSHIKRTKAEEDPELFAIYNALAAESIQIVHEHERQLIEQIARILRDGVYSQEFHAIDEESSATAIFLATARFHHPFHVKDWSSPDLLVKFDAVWNLIQAAIKPKKTF